MRRCSISPMPAPSDRVGARLGRPRTGAGVPAGSAPRSRCSKRRRRLPATIRNAPGRARCAGSRRHRLRTGRDIARVRRALARVQVDIAGAAGAETIEGSHLLIAAGRRPNVEDLDLEAAGIRYAQRHHRRRGLRTSNKQVYAIGDVIGGPQLTHLASHQAGLVIRHALFRTPVHADRIAVPAGDFYRSRNSPRSG